LKNVQSNVEFLTNRLDSVTEKSSLPSQPVVENYNFEFSQPPKVNLTMHTPVDDNSNNSISTLPPITPSHRPNLQHSNSIKFDANEPPLYDDTSNFENFAIETSPSSSYPSENVVEQLSSGKPKFMQENKHFNNISYDSTHPSQSIHTSSKTFNIVVHKFMNYFSNI
jgi:hypothetical protein